MICKKLTRKTVKCWLKLILSIRDQAIKDSCLSDFENYWIQSKEWKELWEDLKIDLKRLNSCISE